MFKLLLNHSILAISKDIRPLW